MKYRYRTIAKPCEGLFKDKGSKFIALASPISSEEDFKQFQSEVKEQYSDAGHHCYAFCYGVNQEHYRFSDDGEPAGTAGKPIYGQLLSNELTHICIIVVRYFGGTKLGVSGLINAYKLAALDAIEHAEIVDKELSCRFEINYPYTDTNFIERHLSTLNGTYVNQSFEADCKATIELPLKNKTEFKATFNAYNPKKLS